MKISKLLIGLVLGIAIGAPIAIFAEDLRVPQSTTPLGEGVAFLHGPGSGLISNRSELSSIERADAWLNTPPLPPAALRGKVVLVHFWTYTCVNWLRTQPYLRAWADRYKEKGLVVIGVHTPEFRFEKNIDNVRREAEALRVDYPIAVDNEEVIWRAFDNNYWPAQYFIDARGRVRHSHFGEGSYDQSEMMIQRLLAETGAKNLNDELVSVNPSGFEVAADWATLKSPENYVGYERTEGFVSPGEARNKPRMYVLPASLRLNEWALAGQWTLKSDAAELNQPNGRLVYRFHARDLHVVMGPTASGSSVKFRVLIDGQPPDAAHGLDVDAKGDGAVTAPRLYQLIRQQAPIADHQFEIEFFDPGVEVFCFTFG
jgi:thiol-disulfide isomerase/thioredoxin